jgi:abequosyltransferase
MQQKLLTIIIPTYNRADCLALLLDTLAQEIAGIEEQVELVVGDNASNDRTPLVAAAFAARCSAAKVLRHEHNVGPEENFCRCIEAATGSFMWLIGDDDLPKTGVVAHVLALLRSSDPDLVYLGSEWLPEIAGPLAGAALRSFTPQRVSSADFAGYVNVWVTFISGMVVNRERLLAMRPLPDLRRFTGTSLVQLGWVLPLLMAGTRLYVVREPCMLATSGNTGGYKLIAVFATNLPRILDSVWGGGAAPPRGRGRARTGNYIPTLLWLTRFGNAARFSGEDIGESLGSLRSTVAYPLVMLPVLRLPRPLASLFWTFSRLSGRAIRLFFTCKLALRTRAPRRSAG